MGGYEYNRDQDVPREKRKFDAPFFAVDGRNSMQRLTEFLASGLAPYSKVETGVDKLQNPIVRLIHHGARVATICVRRANMKDDILDAVERYKTA